MSNTKTCSGISLQEIWGLIEMLMKMINGPKGRVWLEAFKRFLRKETTWKFTKIFQVKIEQKSTNLWEVLGRFRSLGGMKIFSQIEELANNDRPVFYSPNNPKNKFDVVAIKLSDLIPPDKVGVWKYEEIVAEAVNQGFWIPRWDEGLILGLQAIAGVLQPNKDYVVLCDPIRLNSEGPEHKWLPYVAITTNQGSVRLVTKGVCLEKDLSRTPLCSLDTVLVMFWKD